MTDADLTPLYHEHPNQRSPCLLVLDISDRSRKSLSPGARDMPMQALQQGLDQLKRDLRLDTGVHHRVQICIIEAGGPHPEARLALDWVDAVNFCPPNFDRGQTSHLAEGMRMALQHIEEHKETLRTNAIGYTRPWIMAISSGVQDEPDAVWDAVAKDSLQAEQDKRCNIFPIVLEGGDPAMLKRLSASPVARTAPANLSHFFRWLSGSLGSTSRSAIGGLVPLPSTRDWAVFR